MKYLKPRTLPIFLPTDDGIKYCLLPSYYLTKIAVSAGMVDSLKLYVKQTKKLEYGIKKGIMHVKFISNLCMSMKRMCQRKICYRLYYAKVKIKLCLTSLDGGIKCKLFFDGNQGKL